MGSGNSYAAGLVLAGSATNGGNFLRKDGTWQVPPNTQYSDFVSSTAGAVGTAGLVPAPAAGTQGGTYYLNGDKSFSVPPDTNTWVANAVTVAGYVAAPSATDANLVWKTNGSGEPAWRADATGDNTTYSIDVPAATTNINLKGANPTSNDAIALTPSTGISITRNNDSQLTFANTLPDTGVPAILSDGTLNRTAALIRSDIGAGTGDGDVTASSTTTFTNKSGSNSQWTNDEGYTTNTGTVTPSSTDTFTNKSGNISMWTNDSGYLTSYTEADTLQSVTARGDTTNQRILMNGSGSDAYLYVAGNAATTAPTNDQGMAFVYNNSGGSRENEIYFNPGSVTPAENATYYFALINEYLNSSSSNARVTDTLFKLYGNGNLELTGPTATSTIANTFWRMPKTAAPGTGYYLSKASGSINLVWTAPPTTGDITSVTAGTGMTGGGTSGGVTLNVIGGNGITANANDITMSGSYTGDLTITGDAVTDSYRFRANHSNPTTSTATLYDQSNVGATISAYRFAVRNSDGTNMLASALFTDTSLTVVGDVIAYGSPSDIRLKENIKPIESALDKVSKLQGVTFNWKKSDSILDIKEDVGFIAQDVQKVIPELVRENKDGMLSMRHQGIAPILLEAIKELKAEIEELKSNKCNCNK